jgi:hypothetical protein
MRPGARFGDDQSLLIAFPLRDDGRRTIVTPNRMTGTDARFADGITDDLRVALRLREFADKGCDGIGGGIESSVHAITNGTDQLVWDGSSLKDDSWRWKVG